MKRILFVIFMVLMLATCGKIGEYSIDEINVEAKEVKNDVYFKDNELKIDDFIIKITKTKIIPVGEIGNSYGKKPILAIWYDTTNLSDKGISPTSAWLKVFTAIQDNNPNAINELTINTLPDSQFLYTKSQKIKKNETVSNAVAYELDDLETPVTLVAKERDTGDEIGRVNFELK